MSHFTKLEAAKVTDVEAFFAACRELGMTVQMKACEMRAWAAGDAPIEVDYCAKFPTSKYGIGLQRNARGSYDMVSDWSLTGCGLASEIRGKLPNGAGGTDGPGNPGHAFCEALRGRVLRDVTRHAIVAKYRAQGFRATVTEDDEQNLNVELVKA